MHARSNEESKPGHGRTPHIQEGTEAVGDYHAIFSVSSRCRVRWQVFNFLRMSNFVGSFF